MRLKQIRHTENSAKADRASNLSLLLRRCVCAVTRLLQQRRAAPGSELEIEDKLTLGPKKSVFVIRCHGQRFLVATGAETVSAPIAIGVLPVRQMRGQAAASSIQTFRLNAPGKVRIS